MYKSYDPQFCREYSVFKNPIHWRFGVKKCYSIISPIRIRFEKLNITSCTNPMTHSSVGNKVFSKIQSTGDLVLKNVIVLCLLSVFDCMTV